jgi:hypothetical protein
MTGSPSPISRKKVGRIIGWILLGIVVLGISYVACIFFPPAYYLPHEKPVLILPIPPEYDFATSIMPMGEKINHPDPINGQPGFGHPGIDFTLRGLTEKVPYIASMDGWVSKVRLYPYNEDWGKGDVVVVSKTVADVVIVNGPYQTVYSEMDAASLPAAIRVGARIRQGDVVGYGNLLTVGDPWTYIEMIHWEFGSISPIIDRFCPLTYFMDESRARIQAIWAQTDWPEMKAGYPLICNGWWEGKVEK